MPFKDPEVRRAKQREYSAQHYRRNTEERKAANKKNRKRVIDWMREYKASVGCFSCEESDPACIDFHHVFTEGKRSRTDSTSRWIYDRGWGAEKILEEINKTCVPLCCNCHRKVHAQHRQWLKEENEAGK